MSKRSEYMKEWARKNPEKKKVNDQRTYQKHRQERILTSKRWAVRNVEKIRQYKKRWIRFKDKRIQLEYNPRIGICSYCHKTIESGKIKRTNMHHFEYEEIDVLAHTIELCVSCHHKIHTNIIVNFR